MTIEITREVAAKVLSVVDAGLVKGVGVAIPGQMCVEAAVCYAFGLPHGDAPQCVSPALRTFKIKLNDANWSSEKARANGLRRLALVQLGSAGHLDEKEFARRIVDLAIRKAVPSALRIAASVHKDPTHQAALMAAAERCEKEGTRQAANDAKKNASAASAAYAAATASAADAYADAYAYAASAYAASAAASAASAASTSAAASAAASVYDQELVFFAEQVVQILVKMRVPGVQWLTLAPL